MIKRFALVLCALVLLTVVGVPSAHAQGAGETPFVIVPAPSEPASTVERGYWVYQLGAGGRATGTLLLQNPGPEPVTLVLDVVDAQTAHAGGVAFVPAAAPKRLLARWITLDQQRITLGPQRQRTVKFTLRVPAGVRAAQYLAGIAASVVPAEPRNHVYLPFVYRGADGNDERPLHRRAHPQLTVHTRTVLAVQADVIGDWTPKLALSGVRAVTTAAQANLHVEMSNVGDTFLRPSGVLTLRDQQGQRVFVAPIMMGLVVARTRATFEVPQPEVPAGRYTARVLMHYGGGKIVALQEPITITQPASADVEEERAADGASGAPTDLWNRVLAWVFG